MQKGIIVGIVIAIIVVLGIVGFMTVKNTTNGSLETNPSTNVKTGITGSATTGPTGAKTYTIGMTSSGFNPKELTINKGDTVTWVNKDSVGHWPASAVHPTHTIYPGSGIQKCGTSGQPGIFDACGDITSGQSWSFKFNEVGSWGYHDHSQTTLFGKINVQ